MEAMVKREVAGILVGSTTFRPVEKSLKRLLPAPVGNQSPNEPRATKQCKTSIFFSFASLDVYMVFVVRKNGN